jgi:hypothetical protein
MNSSIVNKDYYTNKDLFQREYNNYKLKGKLDKLAKKLNVKKQILINYNSNVKGNRKDFTPPLNFWLKFSKVAKKSNFEKFAEISTNNINYDKIENIIKKNKSKQYFLIVLEFIVFDSIQKFHKFISEGINRSEIEIIGIKEIVNTLYKKFKTKALSSNFRIKLIGIFLKY